MKRKYDVFTLTGWIILGVILGMALTYCWDKDCWSPNWNAIASIGTVVAAVIALVTYRDTVKRESELETIKEFSQIRSQFPNLSGASDEERTEYLKEMERFCTGINLGLYDKETLKRIAGSMLKTQYNDYMEALVQDKRENARNAKAENLYAEYEKVIRAMED